MAEAQEEAGWSAFTRYIRAPSQGKWIFPNRNRMLATRRTKPVTVFLAVLLACLVFGAVIAIVAEIVRMI